MIVFQIIGITFVAVLIIGLVFGDVSITVNGKTWTNKK